MATSGNANTPALILQIVPSATNFQNPSDGVCHFDYLPAELGLMVLMWLDAADLSRASMTCKYWNDLACQAFLKVFKQEVILRWMASAEMDMRVENLARALKPMIALWTLEAKSQFAFELAVDWAIPHEVGLWKDLSRGNPLL